MKLDVDMLLSVYGLRSSMETQGVGMQHFNGAQMCAIDTETTGLDPFLHEMWQIAIVPLDHQLKPRKDVHAFYIEMKLEKPELIDWDVPVMKKNRALINRAQQSGHDQLAATDMFVEWVGKLGLPETKWGNRKKIIPLGHNYAFDKAFIQQWLGTELYEENFHYHFRDSMIAAGFLSDHAGIHGESAVPFPNISLTKMASKLDVTLPRDHDALQDALATAEVYRRLCMRGIL